MYKIYLNFKEKIIGVNSHAFLIKFVKFPKYINKIFFLTKSWLSQASIELYTLRVQLGCVTITNQSPTAMT